MAYVQGVEHHRPTIKIPSEHGGRPRRRRIEIWIAIREQLGSKRWQKYGGGEQLSTTIDLLEIMTELFDIQLIFDRTYYIYVNNANK